MGERILSCVFLSVVVLFAAGCMGVTSPAMGVIITDVKWGGAATTASGTKQGKACATSMFAIIAKGDASVEAAKKAGGITEVASIDHYTKHTVFFGEFCTIVTGK